jgi:hypothetical protein
MGRPDSLWVLLLAQVLGGVVFLVIPILATRFPGTVHAGLRKLSDFTTEPCNQILLLLADMTGNMSVLLSLLFSVLVLETIHAATSSYPHFVPARQLRLFLAGVAVNIVYYTWRVFREVNAMRRENSGTL